MAEQAGYGYGRLFRTLQNPMVEIFFSSLLYYSILSAFIITFFSVKIQSLAFSVSYFAIVLFIALVNYEVGFIVQKDASELAYLEYLGQTSNLSKSFYVQSYFNYLGFFLFERWEVSIGVNIAIFSALVLLIDRINYAYLMIFFAPAVIHIEIVALRDVLLTINMLILCQILLRTTTSTTTNILCALPFLALIYMQRPELVLIFAIALGVIYCLTFTNAVRMLVIGFMALLAVFILPRTTVFLGLPPAGSLLQFMEMLILFSETRADRWVGTDGATSAMLGGRLTDITLIIRYPLQVFLFFFSPFPTDFRGVTHVIIALDSLVFLLVFRMFWRCADSNHKILLMVYILLMAWFMANYGNLFRMRMPCYFIMMSGFLTYYRLQRPVHNPVDRHLEFIAGREPA